MASCNILLHISKHWQIATWCLLVAAISVVVVVALRNINTVIWSLSFNRCDGWTFLVRVLIASDVHRCESTSKQCVRSHVHTFIFQLFMPLTEIYEYEKIFNKQSLHFHKQTLDAQHEQMFASVNFCTVSPDTPSVACAKFLNYIWCWQRRPPPHQQTTVMCSISNTIAKRNRNESKIL